MAALAVAFTISGFWVGGNHQLSAQEDPSKIKPLAEGVLKVIPTVLDRRDSFSVPMELPGLEANEYELNYAAQSESLLNSTRQVIFYRNVWEYEFAFTGLRQKSVSVQYPDGTIERKNVWYLVWRCRDFGKSLSYETETDEFGHTDRKLVEDAARTNRDLPPKKFVPSFTLEGYVKPNIDAKYSQIRYGDINSASLAKYIQSFEDPHLKLLTKQEMSEAEIPLAQQENDPGVWGVAIWEDVDPRIDFVSVYVRGLTNAYRIVNDDGNISFKYKTLQLNFWRAGDQVGQERDDVDYGIPLVDRPGEQVEICRYYNLPGPLLRGYVINRQDNREIQLVELDGRVNLETFESPFVEELDRGVVPDVVMKEFAKAGADLGENVQLKMKDGPSGRVAAGIRGERWTFNAGGKDYILQYEPQIWRKSEDGIEFIKSLDHLWIYR